MACFCLCAAEFPVILELSHNISPFYGTALCFYNQSPFIFAILHKGLLHGMMNLEHMRKQKKHSQRQGSQACKTQSCSINAIRSFLQYHNHGWFNRSVVFHTNYRQAGNLCSFLQYFSPMMSTTRADQPVKGLHVMGNQKITKN